MKNQTFQIVIVDVAGSHTYKYPGNYSMSDAIVQAMKTTGLSKITSVTATILNS